MRRIFFHETQMMLKMGIDLIMTVLLFCQMAYMLIGETAHEWLGAAMFLLFILHHILNWRWYRNLIKGRYGALRILQTIVNVLVFVSMIGLMVSGVILSREVFVFLPIDGSMSFARTLHMLASYWGLHPDECPSRPALGHDHRNGAEDRWKDETPHLFAPGFYGFWHW